MRTERIYSLDVFKLLLAYVIAYFHCGMQIMPGPTVSVELFFVFSGYFLAAKYYARSCPDGEAYTAWDYTADHLRSLYPPLLFAWGVYAVYNVVREMLEVFRTGSAELFLADLREAYQELDVLLFIQSAWQERDGIMHVLWQMSAIVIAGYFLYALLCRSEKTTRRLILPAAILGIESLLSTGVGLWSNYGFFYIPLLRAFSPMSIGFFIYYFTRTQMYSRLRGHMTVLNILSVAGVIAIFYYAELRNLHYFWAAVIIWACLQPESWLNRLLNHRIFRGCGKLSYAVYLNHLMIARIVMNMLMTRAESLGISETGWQIRLAYFVLLTAWSAFAVRAEEFLTGRLRARREKTPEKT